MGKNIYLFFGPPGSGKGTQSDILGKKLKLPVVSTGELLRHEQETKTKIGLIASNYLTNGKLVPNKIIQKILDKRFKKSDTKKGFVFDGFPRSEEQLDLLRARLHKSEKGSKVIAIYIKVGDQEVKTRIIGRRVCDCGAAYHLKYNPPKKAGKCDLCGKKLVQREDDKPKIISCRLKHFYKTIKPILHYFNQSHILIEVNGEKSIKSIEKEIIKNINKLNK